MSSVATWPAHAQHWLDERGKGAWIALMVLGFIVFWPIGLALLFYMMWSNRMSRRGFGCGPGKRHHFTRHSSGNVAFDAYKEDTLKRLESEQQAFQEFLDRLRAAKDKSEFDQFMDDRAAAARANNAAPTGPANA